MASMVLILYLARPLLLQCHFSILALILALGTVGVLALYNGEKGRLKKAGQFLFMAFIPCACWCFYGLHQWLTPA